MRKMARHARKIPRNPFVVLLLAPQRGGFLLLQPPQPFVQPLAAAGLKFLCRHMLSPFPPGPRMLSAAPEAAGRHAL